MMLGWDGGSSLMFTRGGGACDPKTGQTILSLLAFFEREPALMKPLVEEARNSNSEELLVRILALCFPFLFFPPLSSPPHLHACEPLCSLLGLLSEF